MAGLMKFVTIQPTFHIVNKAKAQPLVKKFVERTSTEAGCLYYGFTQDGDKLFCREAYVDGAAANAHLANVGALLGELLDGGAATLDALSIHGPAAELEVVKPGTEQLGTKYFEILDGFVNFKTADSTPMSAVTIQPTFHIVDKVKAQPLVKRFVERTSTEAGCLYYGFTQDGDKLFCREAYVDGAAANAHLANVGALLGELLDGGAATLDALSIHGPAAELEVVKPGTEQLGAKYFEVIAGFDKVSLC